MKMFVLVAMLVLASCHNTQVPAEYKIIDTLDTHYSTNYLHPKILWHDVLVSNGTDTFTAQLHVWPYYKLTTIHKETNTQ